MPIKLSNNNKSIKHYILYGGFRRCITNISNGNFKTFKPLLASGVMLLLAIFSVTLNAPPTLASSISLSVTSSSESLNLLPTASTPAFGKSGTITATLSTDSASGYTFTVTGPDDNKELTGTNSSNKIASIASAIGESTFSNASNTTYNNKWGFLPSKLDSVANTNYQPGPKKTTPTTIDVTASANGTANTYTFAIATKVDNSQAKDKYSTTLNLLASANATQYYIGYVEATTTLPSPTTGSTTDATVTLSNQTPTKSGYAFKGWCSVVTTDDTCSGTTYQPGATYTLSNGAITNLYAMWKEIIKFDSYFASAGKTQSNGYYKMQDMTSTICSNAPVGAESQLIDTRDNKVYYVGKLADNKCWMLDNLAFTGKNSSGSYITMTSSNTNVSSKVSFGSSVVWANGTSSTYTAPLLQDNSSSFKASNSNSGMTGVDTSSWKYGVHYNYCAATAKTYCAADGSGSGDASSSVCPAGWRLPTGGSSGEFKALYTAYSSTYASFVTALRLPLSGYVDYGSLYNGGSYGYFWSSTYRNSNYMYSLYFDTSSVYTANSNNRYYGYSVRCVAQ